MFTDGYTTKELNFRWNNVAGQSAVEINDKIELPEHIIASTNMLNCTKTYNTTGERETSL